MPVLGAVTDASLVVGERAGSGLFTALALRTYANPSVLDYGADPTGLTDSTTAVQAAFDAGVLRFPPGVYALSGKILATLPTSGSFHITGSGREETELRWSNADGGLHVTFVSDGNWTCTPSGNALTIADMTLSTSVQNGGSGIYIYGGTATGEPVPPTTFRGITLRGTTPEGTEQWTHGINLLALGVVAFNDVFIFGADLTAQTAVGIRIAGDGSPRVTTQFVMTGVNTTFLDVAVAIGDYVEGVTITGSNFSWCNIGVLANAAIHAGLQCSVVNTQIQAFSYGIALTGFADNQLVGNLLIIGNPGYAGTHATGAGVGIQLSSAGSTQVVANSINGASQVDDVGIVVANPQLLPLSAMASTIEANSFAGLNTAVWIQDDTSNVTVGNANGYSSNVTTRITDSGSNNVKQPTTYAAFTSPALANVTSAYFTVAVPVNHFAAAPTAAFAMQRDPGVDEMICWYSHAGSTATLLEFLVTRRDGTAFAAATYNFCVVAFT